MDRARRELIVAFHRDMPESDPERRFGHFYHVLTVIHHLSAVLYDVFDHALICDILGVDQANTSVRPADNRINWDAIDTYLAAYQRDARPYLATLQDLAANTSDSGPANKFCQQLLMNPYLTAGEFAVVARIWHTVASETHRKNGVNCHWIYQRLIPKGMHLRPYTRADRTWSDCKLSLMTQPYARDLVTEQVVRVADQYRVYGAWTIAEARAFERQYRPRPHGPGGKAPFTLVGVEFLPGAEITDVMRYVLQWFTADHRRDTDEQLRASCGDINILSSHESVLWCEWFPLDDIVALLKSRSKYDECFTLLPLTIHSGQYRISTQRVHDILQHYAHLQNFGHLDGLGGLTDVATITYPLNFANPPIGAFGRPVDLKVHHYLANYHCWYERERAAAEVFALTVMFCDQFYALVD